MSGDDSKPYRETDDGQLQLLATREDTFKDLDGDVTTNERQVVVAEVPADFETVKDIWHALGSYLADQKEARTGPPASDGIPMHQKYASMEPER